MGNESIDYETLEEDYEKRLKEQEHNDVLVLEELKSLLNDETKYNEIIEFLEEDGGGTNFGIVDEKDIDGIKQEEGYWFKYVYIDQHCGCCEDNYYGTVWIPLWIDNKFFKFDFSC